MDAPASDAPLLEGLDEVAVALLVALTMFDHRVQQQAWVATAQVLAGTECSPEALDVAAGELVARGHAALDDVWVLVSLDLATAFAVLHEAHARGWLAEALARLEGSGRRSLSVWSVPRLELGHARALLVVGAVGEAMRRLPRFADRLGQWSDDERPLPWTLRLLGLRPQRGWLAAAPDRVAVDYARALGSHCLEALVPLPAALLHTVLDDLAGRDLSASKRNPLELLRAAMLWLPAEDSAALPARRGASAARKLSMLRAFALGDLEACYADGLRVLSAAAPARPSLTDAEGVALTLAALDAARRGEDGAWTKFEVALEGARSRWDASAAFELLGELHRLEAGGGRLTDVLRELEDVFDGQEPRPWPVVLCGALLVRWLDVPAPATLPDALRRLEAVLQTLPTPMLPRTVAALRDPRRPPDDTLAVVYASRPPWQHALEQLEAFADAVAEPLRPEPDPDAFRPSIVWEVRDDADGCLAVEARLIASPRSQGGRSIRIDEVLAKFGHVADAHDEAAATAWIDQRDELRGSIAQVTLSEGEARMTYALAFALVGHPRVRDPGGGPVAVARAKPRLVVEQDDLGARVSIEPEGLVGVHAIAHAWDGPDRLALFSCDPAIGPVFGALAGLPDGRIPVGALRRLRPTLARLTEFLSLEGRGGVDLAACDLPPQTGIDVDLDWRDPTLRIEVGVRPLGRYGPRCRPGQGRVDVVFELAEGLRSTRRDLVAEQGALQAVLERCPGLAALEVDTKGGRFVVGIERACTLLEELTAVSGEGLFTLGWPRGQALRLSRVYEQGDLQIAVRRARTQWLAFEAGLPAEGARLVAWRELIDGRAGANRFVPLAGGEVLRLSDSLRRTLDGLLRLDPGGLDPRLAEAPDFVLPAVRELLGDAARLASDVAARKAQIEAALTESASVPDGLQAQLRDYQREGFVWLMRRARAGLGGVLADDMGLGKTVQSLAMLLARAPEGPALVVCPTSVLANWSAEAQRFAPSLRVVDVAALPAAERLEVLEAIAPGEVALMSYGVLRRLGDDVGGLHFATVVFDEVHALKNPKAAQTQIALELGADVRFGLTGTPLENNIGELWSVMHVCVPGLLGDRVIFTESLGKSVVQGVAWAKRHLQALLDPFVLRRTRAQVLRELPPRTESTFVVEPSAAERAWYEAQRQAAKQRIEDALRDQTLRKGQAAVRMLVEIGRLRRAAVEPRLVEDDAPRGAKLDRVVERTRQLVSAGHQILVFTQMLGVLARLGERLRRGGIVTLELQGKTPAAERARRVEAFQAGEADVFLMSLRAGGVGLNLTAASYVLHVDPWWNPAVEEQATGRAHRMGQTQPVTVYRFCTEGTIEAKILDLHEEKRALFDDVLGGVGQAEALDVETLHGLLTRW